MRMNARPRRLRERGGLRALVRETRLDRDQLVMPLVVRPGRRVRAPIGALPGHMQWSPDTLAEEARAVGAMGIPAVLLFGTGERKDARGSRAWAASGAVQQALRAVKRAAPELVVMTDVCLCAYTSHGHCGVLGARRAGVARIENDATLELLARVARSHAAAGADLVAPSGMMDGAVGEIRAALDGAGRQDVGIMSYAVKYDSAFYGPFREAVDSAPAFGDRRTYQMDHGNSDEALREARLDLHEGADILMVKPALAYLDVVRRLKTELGAPLAAYSVSGEYAMVKAAAARGWLDERAAREEMLTAIVRAGADLVITYWAKDLARDLAARSRIR
ncbi:MAG TPA: porphobilinogen synthase [bacterium]